MDIEIELKDLLSEIDDLKVKAEEICEHMPYMPFDGFDALMSYLIASLENAQGYIEEILNKEE